MTISQATPALNARSTSSNILPLQARAPERLVGVGFRCWLAGFSTGDIGRWEEAWNTFAGTLGEQHAKPLLLDLSQFVRAVQATTQRDIEVGPSGCRAFCRDECLAISMIAACQHDARTALTASAAALIGSDDIGDVLNGAQTFACGLREANQMLCMESICPATCAMQALRRRPI
jgi:hypothetical protein